MKVISLYHFFKPNYDLGNARLTLRQRMLDLGIRGTILLAQEGINGSFAGPEESMNTFMTYLQETIKTTLPALKISYSDNIPFKRTLVKVKPFIVHEPSQVSKVDLLQNSSPYISPQELHQWMEEDRPIVLLDTRNDYEYEAGRFKNSVHLGTKHFADFEEDLNKAPQEWKDTPIVTFCTGGIRCEKAAPLMIKKGFRQVYQLEGGILNYFEKIGQGYFEGSCFVFDQRVGVHPPI